MKFYYSSSACSLAVRITLNELNLAYQAIAVDLKTKKTQEGQDFLAINPKGAVPTLMLDSKEVLTENQVILQYLADTYSAHQLLAPVGEIRRYHILEWLNYVATEIHKSFGVLFFPAITEEMKTKVYLPMIHKKLAYLNQHLSDNFYLMGDAFTLPDAYLYVVLRWTTPLHIDLKGYPAILSYMKKMSARPSVVQSLEQEQS